MSGDYSADDFPDREKVYALRDLAAAAERIADTLDDYMEMSLAGIEVTNGLKGLQAPPSEEMLELLKPLTDALANIRDRRAARR